MIVIILILLKRLSISFFMIVSFVLSWKKCHGKPLINNCIFSKKIPFLSIHHTIWVCPRILNETQHLTKCVISIKEPLLKLNRAFVFRVNNWLRWNLASTTGTNFPYSTSWFESGARRSWDDQTFAYARGYWSWHGGYFVTENGVWVFKNLPPQLQFCLISVSLMVW